MQFKLRGNTVKVLGLDDSLRYPDIERVEVKKVGRGEQWIFECSESKVSGLISELRSRVSGQRGTLHCSTSDKQSCKKDLTRLKGAIN